MIGPILALFGGICFSLSNAFIRKGAHRSGESYTVLPIWGLLGTVSFGIPVLLTGQLSKLGSVSWVAILALVSAGIIHFILGRMLGFAGMRYIGATRAVPILSGSILFAALLGVFILKEPLTLSRGLAILLIVGGVLLISSSTAAQAEKTNLSRSVLLKGLLLTLGGSVCWGITPALIKIGVREVDSSLLATFVSYASAIVVIGFTLLFPANYAKMRTLSKEAAIPIVIGGIAVTAAQFLRYTALSFAPVSVVEPLSGSMNSLFIFPLSLILNRHIEAFGIRVILGAIAIIAGIFVMFWQL